MEVKEQLQRLTSRDWQSWDLNKDLTSKSVHFPLNHEDHRKRYLRNPTDVGWPFQTANPEFPWEFLIFYAKSWSCQFCGIVQHTDRKCHLTSLSVKQTLRTAILAKLMLLFPHLSQYSITYQWKSMFPKCHSRILKVKWTHKSFF